MPVHYNSWGSLPRFGTSLPPNPNQRKKQLRSSTTSVAKVEKAVSSSTVIWPMRLHVQTWILHDLNVTIKEHHTVEHLCNAVANRFGSEPNDIRIAHKGTFLPRSRTFGSMNISPDTVLFANLTPEAAMTIRLHSPFGDVSGRILEGDNDSHLFVFDLDDTLLPSNGIVPQNCIQTIRRLKAAGHALAIASFNRSAVELLRVNDRLDEDFDVIACGLIDNVGKGDMVTLCVQALKWPLGRMAQPQSDADRDLLANSRHLYFFDDQAPNLRDVREFAGFKLPRAMRCVLVRSPLVLPSAVAHAEAALVRRRESCLAMRESTPPRIGTGLSPNSTGGCDGNNVANCSIREPQAAPVIQRYAPAHARTTDNARYSGSTCTSQSNKASVAAEGDIGAGADSSGVNTSSNAGTGTNITHDGVHLPRDTDTEVRPQSARASVLKQSSIHMSSDSSDPNRYGDVPENSQNINAFASGNSNTSNRGLRSTLSRGTRPNTSQPRTGTVRRSDSALVGTQQRQQHRVINGDVVRMRASLPTSLTAALKMNPYAVAHAPLAQRPTSASMRRVGVPINNNGGAKHGPLVRRLSLRGGGGGGSINDRSDSANRPRSAPNQRAEAENNSSGSGLRGSASAVHRMGPH